MSNNFAPLFAELRDIMLRSSEGMIVARDEPGDLELRTPDIDPKTGKPGWFGIVNTKKTYVAYHIMPLYTDSALAGGVSPALARRKHGKTCFNFKKAEPALFAELELLTAKAMVSCQGVAVEGNTRLPQSYSD